MPLRERPMGATDVTGSLIAVSNGKRIFSLTPCQLEVFRLLAAGHAVIARVASRTSSKSPRFADYLFTGPIVVTKKNAVVKDIRVKSDTVNVLWLIGALVSDTPPEEAKSDCILTLAKDSYEIEFR